MTDAISSPSAASAAGAEGPGGTAQMLGDDRRLMWAFTGTTFLSALLLFSVQPMFAKMVLPVLGGSPSVWAVAMFFFQAALLAGYCYAHFLIARLPVKSTGWVHLALIVLALVSLPIALPANWSEPPAGEPYLWQIGLFSVAVGLPFLAVSANAPLMQAWFASTGHRDAKDPYFLYAASNLGSMIALLGYPFVLEPAFGVTALSKLWTYGFGLLALCIGGLFWLVRQRETGVRSLVDAQAAIDTGPIADPTWGDRLAWVGLALVPSALLTAFTTHITTDVASAPLLWVIPLALYLLTFVLVFRDKVFISDTIMLMLHRVSVVVVMLVLSQTRKEGGLFVTAPLGFMVFFFTAMVAHRTLYLRRPHAKHLTEFYLWMSLGGALGGLSAALIAPQIFSQIYEYPLLIALSMACRPGALTVFDPSRYKSGQATATLRSEAMVLWLMLAAGILAIYWVPWAMSRLPSASEAWSTYQDASGIWAALLWPLDKLRSVWAWVYDWSATPIIALATIIVLMANDRHPFRQLLAAVVLCLVVTKLPSTVNRSDSQRSYFGVYRVQQSSDGEFNTLIHGTTLHGAQRVRDADGNPVADVTPATYYHPGSPMAKTVARRRELLAKAGKKGSYGVIGLGTGSLACYAEAGESWRFYEIDPLMVSIARESGNFTFMENCLPNADVVIGDARLTVQKEPVGKYDVLIVDAFSSDSVPVHLMTAEALKLYASKVAPDGVVVLHISNRYLDLDAVVGATIKSLPGFAGVLVSDDDADGSYSQSSSTVVVFSRSEAALENYKDVGAVKPLDTGTVRAWTDDYSDILGPFRSKYRKRFSKD